MDISQATITRYIDRHWDEIVQDIANVVAIPSVENIPHAQPHAPFGPEVAQALEQGLEIACRLGLSTHNCEGYLGYADLLANAPRPSASESPAASDVVAFTSNTTDDVSDAVPISNNTKKQIAVFGHLDVVPAGPGWDFEPYALTKKEGYLCGRGVVDDKSPAILSLWAAHFFMEHPLERAHDLRVMLGTNEETHMNDAKYYNKHYPAPDFLFTPDSYWPVVIGEKGTYNGEISFDLQPQGRIVSFEGGTVRNAVASRAQAVIRARLDETPEVDGITPSDLGDGTIRLEAQGVGGHASLPQGTKSAIGMLGKYLYDHELYSPAEKTWFELQHRLYASWDGSLLGVDATDDVFSPLTIVSGVIGVRDGQLVQTIDARWPKSTNPDRISEQLTKVCQEHGARFCETHRGVCMYQDPQQEEIQALLSSFTQWSPEKLAPITLGGGTYAKHFPYAVAFGPEYEHEDGRPAWVGSIHGPNEAISEASLQRALAIYITALGKLLG